MLAAGSLTGAARDGARPLLLPFTSSSWCSAGRITGMAPITSTAHVVRRPRKLSGCCVRPFACCGGVSLAEF